MVNADGRFDFCVADNIVLGEFLHAERVEGEVKPPADLGDAVHQSFKKFLDLGFLSSCATTTPYSSTFL